MNLRSNKGNPERGLPRRRFARAIGGIAVDHRGEAALRWCAERSEEVASLRYDPEKGSFYLNDSEINQDTLHNYFKDVSIGRIILEATTLGFVEIAHCCRS